MVSHDLKNPLGAIKGYAQLLQRGLASGKETDKARLLTGLARINSTVGKMTGQINELLDFAQIRVGQPLELVKQEVDLVVSDEAGYYGATTNFTEAQRFAWKRQKVNSKAISIRPDWNVSSPICSLMLSSTRRRKRDRCKDWP